MGRSLSRRELLRRTAAVSAATAVPGSAWAQLATDPSATAPEHLTRPEFKILEAVVARLIPDDDSGPGALEAGAPTYIDRALGNALADSRDLYASGLAAVDALARSATGRSFAALGAAMQDALLTRIDDSESGEVGADLTAFFDLLLRHTIEGTFGDPYYGGNRDFVGWDMIGYPGLRLAVGAREQRMDSPPEPTRVSAYDLPMFAGLDPASEFDAD